MFPSYRNQSTDLHCKPIDWFLYDKIIGLNELSVEIRHLKMKSYVENTENMFKGYFIKRTISNTIHGRRKT